MAAGVDDGQDNPLTRATDCLFGLGKPFTRLNQCFFQDPQGPLRWLGIFVHSAGDRVIFFPGFFAMEKNIKAYSGEAVRWDLPFCIDHLSLEPDWQSWHFTEPRSVSHVGKMYTQRVGPEAFHWFSLSVKSARDLRIARKETKVSAPTPERDVDRRMKTFMASRDGAEFQIVSLNEAHSASLPCFLHFPSSWACPASDPQTHRSSGRLTAAHWLRPIPMPP